MLLFAFLALFLTTSSSYAVECFNEDCKGVGTFEESKIGKVLNSHNAGLASALKTKEELNEYFACHISTGLGNAEKRKRVARLKEFQSLYQPMIELGAQHFQMPYALSACVMFRESLFDREAISEAGARGIAQFTEPTYKTLQKNISNVVRMERDMQEFLLRGYDDMITYQGSNNMYMRCTQLGQGEGILNRQLTAEEIKTSKENCREMLTDHARYKPIYDNMVSYLKDVSRPGRENFSNRRRKKMFPNTPRGQWPKEKDLLPPKNFEDMLKEPAWVVAMNMFYLKRSLVNASLDMDIQNFEPSKDMIGFLVTLGGSYNRGPTALENVVSGDKASVREWCQQMGSIPETRDYMLSLRRCMTRNSFDPPANHDNNSDCQKQMTPSSDDPCDLADSSSRPEQSPLSPPSKSKRPKARPQSRQ